MKKYGKIGLAVVLVAGLLAFLVPRLEWEEYTVPAQLRGEAARNPFYAAERFARSLGARAEWRRGLGELPPPPAVLVLKYWQWNLIVPRRIAIERWVEAGGRLVIYGPLWNDEALFGTWTGLSQEYSPSAENESAEAADESTEDDGCQAFTVTDDVNGISAGHPSYRLCTMTSRTYLASRRAPQWSLRDRIGIQAVRVALGRGSVTWLDDAQIFGNRELTAAEHGLVFVAMTQLRRGDQLIFASESGYPSLLTLIWKQGAAIVTLAALAFLALLWRSGVRFGPPAPEPELARRSLVEQIRGTGRFVRRYGDGVALHRAAMRALYEAAQRRMPHWASLPQESRVLELTHALDVSDAVIRDVLREMPRSSHELKRALERLERMRRRLLSGET